MTLKGPLSVAHSHRLSSRGRRREWWRGASLAVAEDALAAHTRAKEARLSYVIVLIPLMFSFLSSTRSTLGQAARRLVQQRQPSLVRGRAVLAPKNVDPRYLRRHKGVIPINIGGSIKGTTLAFGEWGIRIKGLGVRLSAKQLSTAQDVLLRKMKVIKGSKVYLRVFPDVPVAIKVRIPSHHGQTASFLMVYVGSRETRRVWVKERGHSSTGPPGQFSSATYIRLLS